MEDLARDADREKAGREAAVKTAKDKVKAAEAAERRAATAEKERKLAEERSAELESKQNETEVKLAEEESRNAALAEEAADLRAALEEAGTKWYDEGFADAEKGVEPVVFEARRLSFHDGWFAALQVLGVPADSPLRDPGKIPFLEAPPVAQSPPGLGDEEETDSLRELVEQIDAHVELVGVEASSNPTAGDPPAENAFPNLASEGRQHEVQAGDPPVDLTV